jgi:hypothetical protein
MRFFAIAAATVALSACSADENLAASDAAIVVFHLRFNAQDYSAIYRDSDPTFRSATTEADLKKLLAAVHSKLGAFQTGKRENWQVNYGTNAGTVILFKSQYAKGKAEETFTFTNGKDAKLIGFNINSPTLITG